MRANIAADSYGQWEQLAANRDAQEAQNYFNTVQAQLAALNAQNAFNRGATSDFLQANQIAAGMRGQTRNDQYNQAAQQADWQRWMEQRKDQFLADQRAEREWQNRLDQQNAENKYKSDLLASRQNEYDANNLNWVMSQVAEGAVDAKTAGSYIKNITPEQQAMLNMVEMQVRAEHDAMLSPLTQLANMKTYEQELAQKIKDLENSWFTGSERKQLKEEQSEVQKRIDAMAAGNKDAAQFVIPPSVQGGVVTPARVVLPSPYGVSRKPSYEGYLDYMKRMGKPVAVNP